MVETLWCLHRVYDPALRFILIRHLSDRCRAYGGAAMPWPRLRFRCAPPLRVVCAWLAVWCPDVLCRISCVHQVLQCVTGRENGEMETPGEMDNPDGPGRCCRLRPGLPPQLCVRGERPGQPRQMLQVAVRFAAACARAR